MYLTSTNEEFNEVIKDVKRRWTQDLLRQTYSLADLMATAAKTCNNIVADGGWTLSDKKGSVGYSKEALMPSFWRCWLKLRSSRKEIWQG